MDDNYGISISSDDGIGVEYDDAYTHPIKISDEDGSVINLTEAQYKWLLSHNILKQGKGA